MPPDPCCGSEVCLFDPKKPIWRVVDVQNDVTTAAHTTKLRAMVVVQLVVRTVLLSVFPAGLNELVRVACL